LIKIHFVRPERRTFIYVCHYMCFTVYTVYNTYIDLKESRHHLSTHHERVFESETAATD